MANRSHRAQGRASDTCARGCDTAIWTLLAPWRDDLYAHLREVADGG